MNEVIHSSKAPEPIGPYSQAIRSGNMLFISGQIAINPETNELETDELEAETHRVMNNLNAVLEAAGADFEHVVKCSIFLSDMNNFATVNKIYAKYVSEKTPPARETVQVSVLPKNVNVEISAIAVIG